MKIVLLFLASINICFALPEGGVFEKGAGTISVKGNTMTIKVTSDSAIMEWDSFSSKASEVINVVLPATYTRCLFRIKWGGESLLQGKLTSNGPLYLVAPYGIMLSKSSIVQTREFVASSLNVSDQEFLGSYAYHYTVSKANEGISNYGSITCEGNIALIGGSIQALGTMKTNGAISMAAGAYVVYFPKSTTHVWVNTVRDGASRRGITFGNKMEGSVILFKTDGNLHSPGISLKGQITANGWNKDVGSVSVYAPEGNIDIASSCLIKVPNKDTSKMHVRFKAEDIHVYTNDQLSKAKKGLEYINMSGNVFIYP